MSAVEVYTETRMGELFKTLIPHFWSPTNYAEMLKKLASFLFCEVWIATYFLRQIASVGNLFVSIESAPPIGDVVSLIPRHEHLNITGIGIAFLVAGVSHAFQLHDKISDLFGIRRRFDQRYILLPLADLVGVTLTSEQQIALMSQRDEIMHRVFYKYTSSRSHTPLVDKHDIERALDGWCWYWIFIEGMAVAFIASAVSLIFRAIFPAVGFAAVFAILCLFAWLLSFKLRTLARPQIETIAANKHARREIRKVLNALQA
jgi:hypothetical protein